MTLRTKTLLTSGITLLGLMIVLSFVLSKVMLNTFAQLEQEQTLANVERASNALDREIDALQLTIQSWASWDDSREFLHGERPNYSIENNLEGQIVTILRLNMMLFFTNSQDLKYGLSADMATGKIVPVPPSLLVYLDQNPWLFKHANQKTGHTGIVVLPEGPVMLVAYPISDSNYGPIVGTLVAGRYLDDINLEQLRNLTELSVNVFRWQSQDQSIALQTAKEHLLEEPIFAQPLNSKTIAGYKVRHNFAGEPAIILQVLTPRPIYAAGQEGVVSLLVALLVTGIVFSVVNMGLLERVVLARLTKLSKDVTNISTSSDDSMRLETQERDEIGHLSCLINQMLEALALAHRNQQEQAERLRFKAEEARNAAEQANQMKSQFLANMSHELRTPLNSIINFTRIIAAGMRGPVTKDQLDYLNRVWASGEHLLGLINDILDLSKIEAGRMELHLERCYLGTLVRSSLSTATGLIKDKSIELVQDIAEDIPDVSIDTTRIRQVLLNLLSNAAKFTKRGTITVQVEQQANTLVVHVTDTGIGIPPEKIGVIFEEFRQVEEGSERSYEGTGLGLAICKRIVALHGGQIWVQSTPGVGSTFSFSIPIIVEEEPDEAGIVLGEGAAKDGIPLVVIDDDPAVIEIVTSYLSDDGYVIYGVNNSGYAMNTLRQIRPAAIILDIMMPYKNGWEILLEVKADAELQYVPIVLYTVMDDKQLGLSLGAEAYLTKPIDETLLRSTIQRIVIEGATILAIDDDPDVLEVVKHELNGYGNYIVKTARGGKDGLDSIAAEKPDVVILDLMMPEVDGFMVLQQLERDPQTRMLPVIVLTAKELTRDEHEYLKGRVGHLLSKSAPDLEHLRQRVKRVLARQYKLRMEREHVGE